MKRISLYTLITLLFVATSCSNSNTKSNADSAVSKAKAPEREGWYCAILYCDGIVKDPPLYGDVESVEITEYTLKESFGEVITNKIDRKRIYKFNQQGDVFESASYNSDGSLDDKRLSKYDSQGNNIEYAWYNGDGSLDWKFLYKYDSQGNLIEQITYKGDVMTPIEKTEFKITYRK